MEGVAGIFRASRPYLGGLTGIDNLESLAHFSAASPHLVICDLASRALLTPSQARRDSDALDFQIRDSEIEVVHPDSDARWQIADSAKRERCQRHLTSMG
jgi:hypothetical protein